MVRQETVCLLPVCKDKTTRANAVIIHQFMRSMGLTQRAAMHTAQKHFKEIYADANDFIAMMKAKMHGGNLDGVLNMDQTPVPYSYHANKMLDMKGTRTIQARSSMSNRKYVTLAATFTVSGKMLTQFLILKGQLHGRITSRKFAN